MKNVIGTILGLALSVGIIYGGYYIAKTVSYTIFYEGMVIESIKETVKPSCIKGDDDE